MHQLARVNQRFQQIHALRPVVLDDPIDRRLIDFDLAIIGEMAANAGFEDRVAFAGALRLDLIADGGGGGRKLGHVGVRSGNDFRDHAIPLRGDAVRRRHPRAL